MRAFTVTLLLAFVVLHPPLVAGQGTTAFTYQGQLVQGGIPHEGQVEMAFSLWDAESAGSQLGVDQVETVTVSEGLFQVELDFGNQPFSSGLWLEIAVGEPPNPDHTVLSPRQHLRSTPHAIYAAALDHPIGADEVDNSALQLRVGDACQLGSAISQINADGSTVCQLAGGSKWDGVAGDAIYHDGKVGIGLIPTADLHVAGNRAILPGLRLERLQGGYVNIIGAPEHNSVSADAFGATISGGGVPSLPNSALGEFDTVGGGLGNSAGQLTHFVTTASTVSGGQENTAGGYHSTVGGGQENSASGSGSTTGGGRNNGATGEHSAVGGGQGNVAGGDSASIGGGSSNSAPGIEATVSGGQSNVAIGSRSTIGGGLENTASSPNGTIGGGNSNTVDGVASTIGGGFANTAGGMFSTVPGGSENSAEGFYSLAAGRRAKANHIGTFVWADSTDADFGSTGTDQFIVRAEGGVGFGEAPSDYFVINTPFATQDTDYSFGTGALRVRINGATRLRVLGNGGVAIGSSYQTSGVPERGMRVSGVVELASLGTGGTEDLCRNTSDGAIATCSSSRRYKEDIRELDVNHKLLEKLRPVSFRWIDSGSEDIGLIAEEVAEIDARLVTFNSDGQIEGVRYRELSALLIRSLQEHRTDTIRMRSEIVALQKQTEQIDALIEHKTLLEARLLRLETLLSKTGRLALEN